MNNIVKIYFMRRFFVIIILFAFVNCAVSQSFTDIKANLTGVSESASNWIDYNEDGLIDVFVTGDFYNKNKHGISTKLYKNLKRDNFSQVYTPVTNIYRGGFDWADYNNDGIKDLFIIGETADGKLIANLYNNNRTANFKRINVSIPGFRDGSVQWGDYDGDGDDDLLITGYTKKGTVSRVYRNDRNNKFTDIKANIIGVSYGIGKWADYDNDGDLDIIIAGNDNAGRVVTKLYNYDNKQFRNVDVGFVNLKLSDIAWGDYDNDGDLDFVIVGETQQGRFVSRLYNNDGFGGFSQAFANFIAVRSGSVDWGDMDHDGDIDLLITGESNSGAVSRVYRNDRNGVFTDINADVIGLYMSDAHWGDYDNDGDLDILISGMSDNYNFISRVYRNDPVKVITIQKKKQSDDIWNNSVVVYPMTKKVYYYVFASCYCDLYNEGRDSYHVFFSPIKKQKVQYEMQQKFNKLIRNNYPNWVKFDQGHLIESGFATMKKAKESKQIAIDEYKSKGFEIHEVVW